MNRALGVAEDDIDFNALMNDAEKDDIGSKTWPFMKKIKAK